MNCCTSYNGFKKEPTHHSQLPDEEFLESFEKGILEPSLFTHDAHLRLAWLYLQHNAKEKAIVKTCQGIKAFDIMHGKGDKYHVTITVVSVHIVEHFRQKSTANNFNEFIMEFPVLTSDFKSLLGRHYTYDVFLDEVAKQSYVAPTGEPFF